MNLTKLSAEEVLQLPDNIVDMINKRKPKVEKFIEKCKTNYNEFMTKVAEFIEKRPLSVSVASWVNLNFIANNGEWFYECHDDYTWKISDLCLDMLLEEDNFIMRVYCAIHHDPFSTITFDEADAQRILMSLSPHGAKNKFEYILFSALDTVAYKRKHGYKFPKHKERLFTKKNIEAMCTLVKFRNDMLGIALNEWDSSGNEFPCFAIWNPDSKSFGDYEKLDSFDDNLNNTMSLKGILCHINNELENGIISDDNLGDTNWDIVATVNYPYPTVALKALTSSETIWWIYHKDDKRGVLTNKQW